MLLHGCLIVASRVGRRIKLDLKVNGVIICESRIIENSLGSKLGKTRGNVECVDGLLKATTLGIGVELVCDGVVSGKRVTLVDQGHSHSVAKRPGEEVISTMKREMCVPLPVLSPLRYARRQRW